MQVSLYQNRFNFPKNIFNTYRVRCVKSDLISIFVLALLFSKSCYIGLFSEDRQ